MEPKEFAKYHTWCDQRKIRVYPIPRAVSGEFHIAVERNGKASVGEKIFYDKPANKNQTSVWDQIGVLLKMIVYKELNLMEIKSTYAQLEGICDAAIKNQKEKVVLFLSSGVPFREAMLYLEAFYPDHKEDAQLIYKLAHCKCGNAIIFKEGKTVKQCPNCSFKKSIKQIEFSNQ